MPLIVYHNPRCSKSRQTLAIVEESGTEHTVVEYLKTPPDGERIEGLATMLGVPVADLLRTGESEFKEANDLPSLDDDTALAAWISAHPKVLQRPVVVDDEAAKAVIGRPPETVNELLSS